MRKVGVAWAFRHVHVCGEMCGVHVQLFISRTMETRSLCSGWSGEEALEMATKKFSLPKEKIVLKQGGCGMSRRSH